ncbi:MAG: hypothetical protein JJ953_00640 [Gracilimonas sp.]|uniref:hypothetical protein n=1 Tax=Gracilimonas sp. TaxID=1974203 RepID=UPI001B2B0C52|nr:hypothetical protein [Gracilimonas sp.]MBO6584588.1 hypothetical protein [Gracilimonas sp.]MBO6616141.1 hypothetical protein [Gracilimonas sp.]
MYKSFILILAVLSAGLFISGCDAGLSGTASENQPPSTNLTVERINRGDDFRLSSQINISWWGNDPDGYVVGYEYAINDTSEGAWTFTERSDSTFILPITEGQSVDDVLFKVRAVDNEGAKDPVGARLVYPIVNSDPTVSFSETETPPDTLFSISSFGWRFNDPDGLLNIRSTEIAINDTINGWTEIPVSSENEGRIFISLEVDNSSTGTKTADVFLGRSYNRGVDESGDPIQIAGVEVGATNTAYVRSIDAAGAVSQLDSVSWYIKPQRSKVLFLNDIGSNNSLEKQNEHLSYLNSYGIEPDQWLINTGTPSLGTIELSDQFPAVVDPTLQKTLAKWDHIYWVSNDIDRNIVHALEITREFFEQGGNMFVTIPMKEIGQDDDVFNFIPVDSIGDYSSASSRSTNFIINNNTEVPSLTGGPSLLTERTQTSIFPLKPIPGATLLYQTDFQTTTLTGRIEDYTEFEGVGIENPEGNVIYFGMDLTLLNGNNNLADFIEYICIQRLGFSN